jgi:hypothetical protein
VRNYFQDLFLIQGGSGISVLGQSSMLLSSSVPGNAAADAGGHPFESAGIIIVHAFLSASD